jgi:hypothetical protein
MATMLTSQQATEQTPGTRPVEIVHRTHYDRTYRARFAYRWTEESGRQHAETFFGTPLDLLFHLHRCGFEPAAHLQ